MKRAMRCRHKRYVLFVFKAHLHRAKAKEKANIFFDVWHLLFYPFLLFFDLFLFSSRFRLAWKGH